MPSAELLSLLESASRLLARALAPELSDWFARLHRRHGVEVVLGAGVREVRTESGRATGVHLEDGRVWPAGLVLLGVGAEPEDGLARAAGLHCDRGIVVDRCGRTSHPGVVAAGDCTVTRLPDGTWRRLESVQNAVEQGKAAAAGLLGLERPFDAVPWFWSHQYDVKLQLAGLPEGVERWEVRGDPAADTFSLFGFAATDTGPRLLAVQSVNAPRDHLEARALLA